MTRLLPLIAFVAVVVLILGGMHYYVWARLVRDPQLPPGVARLSTAALATMAVLLPATLILSRMRDAPRVLTWIAFLWMGVVFLLFAFLAIGDAGRAAVWAARKLSIPAHPVDPDRRVFLARAFAVGVGGAAGRVTFDRGMIRARERSID